MSNPLGVSPSKGKQGTTWGKEKIFWPRWELKPRPSGLDLLLLCQLSYKVAQRKIVPDLVKLILCSTICNQTSHCSICIGILVEFCWRLLVLCLFYENTTRNSTGCTAIYFQYWYLYQFLFSSLTTRGEVTKSLQLLLTLQLFYQKLKQRFS